LSILKHSKIDSSIIGLIREYTRLAPLHNPPNLLGIEVCMEIFRDIPNIAVFDNLFHKDIPQEAYIYGLPYEYYEKYGIRRYGFHGIAYSYMTGRLKKLMQDDFKRSNIVAIMLGGGSSVTAIKNGTSIDTSMGFTPAEGLIMSTRCGDIDPAILPFIMKNENLSPDEIDDVINKKSGFLGLSGKHSNYKDIENGYLKGDEDCIRVINTYVYKIKKYIGSYAAAMNGLDAIVFGGGIAENSKITRQLILSDMQFLGIRLDRLKNNNLKDEGVISSADSEVIVLVSEVDEESIIAGETFRILS
jgi:acetate kinase